MIKKIGLFVFCSSLIAFQGIAHASEGGAASAVSVNLSADGMGKIINGSGDLLAANAHLSVAAVKTVGDITYITLKAAENSATTTVAVSSHVAEHFLIAAGRGIQVSSTLAGQMLYTAGQMIAFIPNALGRELLYSRTI